LTQLEKENVRLKKLLAEAEFEMATPKDLFEGNFCARSVAAESSRFCKRVIGLLNALTAGWRGSTTAPSTMAARLSTARRPSFAIGFARLPLNTCAGAGGWPVACSGEKAG